MIKSLSVCAVSLILGTPALADERPRDDAVIPGSSGVKVDTASLRPSRSRVPSGQSFDRFALPAQALKFDQRAMQPDLVPPLARPADQPFTPVQGDQEITRQTSLRLTETTSSDGGRYAVHEALSDHRKLRFRRSALGTMLTLRLDGEAESPPFSVGGGGVAAVVWQALPKS